MATHHPAFTLHILSRGDWTHRLNRVTSAVQDIWLRGRKPAAIVAGVTVGGFCALNGLLMAVQFNRAPLFLQAGDITLGLQSTEEAKKRLETQPVPPLQLELGGSLHRIDPKTIGLRIDGEATLRAATDKNGWDALPLVQAYDNARRPARVVYTVDEDKLLAYLATVLPKESKAAVDASIIIPPEADKPAYIVPGADGFYFDARASLRYIVARLQQHEQLRVAIDPQPVTPKISAAQLEDSLARANQLLSARLHVTDHTTVLELLPEHIRPLVRLVPDGNGMPVPVVDEAGTVSVLERFRDTFYRAPTPTVIHRVDGNETGRTEGKAGQALQLEQTAKLVAQALQESRSRVEAVIVGVEAPVRYVAAYSPTSEGLSALIRDFVRSHSGTYQVVVRELGGSRAAAYDEHAQMVPASVFKLFLAYAALHKIEQGQLAFDTQTSEGTVDYCMQRMITVSVDNCAIAIADKIGWEEVDAVIQAAGFGGTRLNNRNGGHKSTTANDIAAILTGLHAGSLVGREHSDYLLALMHRQIYRKGIPAGSSGAPVADKVGILYNWTHDAGIVYSPKATYVLVVLTTGGGFGNIRELSQGVYDLYNQ